METFNPISQKSPISSLRFRRRNDFDKFLKFIKVETKNLKGEKEPAGRGVKKIISNVAKGSIGLGFIIGLFSKKRSEEDFSNKLDISASRLDFTIAPSTPLFRQNASTRKKPERFKPLKSKTKITANDVLTFRKGKSVEPTSGGRQASRIIRKKLESKVTISGKKMATAIVGTEGGSGTRKTVKKQVIIEPKPGEIKASKKLINRKKLTQKLFGKFIKDKNFKSDINMAADMAMLDQIEREAIESQRIKNIVEAESGTKIKDFKPEETKTKPRKKYRSRIKNRDVVLRRGVRGFSNPDPFNRFGTVSNPLMSKNTFKKGAFSKIFNPKVTRDTILGFPTKGKFFTKAAMFFNHPIPKTIGFLLTAYEGYQEGKGIFNLKDNIITNLIDLGISVNNAINADDPSKMRLFIGESSIPERRLMQIRRNKKIMELKNAQNDQANNTVLIPMNTGNDQEGTPTNIPNPNSSLSNIAFNTDQLNIGDMVFLSKLSVG